MRVFRLLWSILVLAAGAGAPPVFASGGEGSHVGNGGDAVVCYDSPTRSKITSVTLFDYWEMDRTLGYPGGIQLGAPELSVQAKLDLALARLYAHDRDLSRSVREIAFSIADHIDRYLVTSEQLPEIDDIHPRALPESPCFIEQFAVQWQDVTSGKRRFAIAAKFYLDPRTTNDTRAGIILHEAIYRTAILRGNTDSDGSRYFNYALATRFLEGREFGEYIQALEHAKLQEVGCRYEESPLLGKKIYVRPAGGWHYTILCITTTLETPRIKIVFGKGARFSIPQSYASFGDVNVDHQISILNSAGNWVSRPIDRYPEFSRVYFSASRTISRLELADAGKVGPPFTIDADQILPCSSVSDRFITLTQDGRIRSCQIAKGVIYRLGGQSLPLDHAFFDDDVKKLKEATFLEEGSVLRVRGSTRSFAFLSAKFDGEGLVYKGSLKTPISVLVMGRPTEIDKLHEFEVDLKTNLTRVDAYHSVLARYQGKRILTPPDGDRERTVLHICHALGYRNYPGSLTAIRATEKSFISGEEVLYDPSTLRFTVKSDETVDLVSDLRCAGRFWVPLP